MILAGDIGGTKTHLGLFEPAPARPVPAASATYATLDFDTVEAMIDRFLADHGGATRPLDAALGVAGPVRGPTAQLTNVPRAIDAGALEARFNLRSLRLLNDLHAMAFAVPVLQPSELVALQEGIPAPDGNMALIAAGTGLGEALLHRACGRLVPSPSEAGHADFAPRTEREIGLLQALVERFGRAEYEQVLSGPGLLNIYRFFHGEACPAGDVHEGPDGPARITNAALERRCPRCADTLELFVSVYGAEAGNLALRSMATSGVYLGGGIAPKILPALASAGFLEAFRDKGPMNALLEAIPVFVILHPRVGLLGAAVAADPDR